MGTTMVHSCNALQVSNRCCLAPVTALTMVSNACSSALFTFELFANRSTYTNCYKGRLTSNFTWTAAASVMMVSTACLRNCQSSCTVCRLVTLFAECILRKKPVRRHVRQICVPSKLELYAQVCPRDKPSKIA